MSYKVRIQSVGTGGDTYFTIENIGTERITMEAFGNSIYIYTGQKQTTMQKFNWSLHCQNGKVVVYGYYPYAFTMYGTDKTYVIDGAVNNNEPFEVELTTEPKADTCRLTSNRLSPPKFNLRKFFRINPLTSARALEVNGG